MHDVQTPRYGNMCSQIGLTHGGGNGGAAMTDAALWQYVFAWA